MLHRKLRFALLAVLFLPTLAVRAADPPQNEGIVPEENPKAGPQALDPFDRRTITGTTVAALVGNRGGVMGGLIVVRGGHLGAWVDTELVRRKLPAALDRDQLIGIEQDKPVAFGGNRDEARAYNFVLLHAHDVPPEEMRKEANHAVTRAHLMEQPERYKGELVFVEGDVRRCRKYDAPRDLRGDGIKNLYELWIYPPYHAEPFCVVVSDLPEGAVVGDSVNYPVEVEAYFFKLYGFKAAGDRYRRAPLLLGSTIRLPISTGAGSTEFLTSSFIPSILTGIAVVVGLGIGLTIWFSRGDRRVQDRLTRMRQMPPSFSEPPE